MNCYNVKTNDCDGSCQGCSSCIMAEYLKGNRKNKPTRYRMKRYLRKANAITKYNNRIFGELVYAKEFRVGIEKLIKETFGRIMAK